MTRREKLTVAVPKDASNDDSFWPVSTLGGPVVGAPFDDLTARRLQLTRQHEMESDTDSQWWESPEGELTVVVREGVIAMINHREYAMVRDQNLIDLDPLRVRNLLGDPDGIHPIDGEWLYDSGPWRLEVGFYEGRVSWVSLSNDECYDQE